MSLPTAEEMISQMMASGKKVTFSWQGGEPTLMGVDFFNEVIELQKKYGSKGQRVVNSIQTNGLLIDDQWCKFLSKYNFLVGLSLDGPPDIHNAYRKHKNGGGSWKQVMEAAKLLQKFRIPFNILAVLNDKTVRKPNKILDFFLSYGFNYLQFIPAIEKAKDGSKLAPFTPYPIAIGKFLDVIFQEWSSHFPPRFSVRYFDALVNATLGEEIGYCKIEVTCGKYLVVEHNGDLYPCDFFVETDYKLGNLNQETINKVEKRSKFRNFKRAKFKIPDECRKCEFLNYCNGGCPRYRNLPGGPKGRTYLCEGYKYFLSRNLSTIKKIVKEARKQKSQPSMTT